MEIILSPLSRMIRSRPRSMIFSIVEFNDFPAVSFTRMHVCVIYYIHHSCYNILYLYGLDLSDLTVDSYF